MTTNTQEYTQRMQYPEHIGGTESKLPYDLGKLEAYIKIAKPWEKDRLLLLAMQHEQQSELDSAQTMPEGRFANLEDKSTEVIARNLKFTNDQLERLREAHKGEWLLEQSTIIISDLACQLFGMDPDLHPTDKDLPRRTSAESTIIHMAEQLNPNLQKHVPQLKHEIKNYGHPSLVRMTVALALGTVPSELNSVANVTTALIPQK